MKKLLFLTLLLLVAPSVKAQQVVMVCTVVSGTQVKNCVPVDATNPLPVSIQ